MRGAPAVTAGRAGRAARTAVDRLSLVLSWVSGGLTLVLLVMLVGEVAVRELVGRSLLGTIELSEALLVLVVALGAAYAQQAGAHVSTDLVTSRFPATVGAAIRVAGMVVAASFLLWTAWASAERGWESFVSGESRFGITEVPVWPARLALPIGLALLALQCLLTGLDAWNRRHDADPDTDPDAGRAAAAGTAPEAPTTTGRRAADVS